MQKKKIDTLMLATEHIDIYTQYSIPIWKKYCDLHGYNFFNYSENLLPDMAFSWSKVKMIQNHLKKTEAEYIIMVDADTFVYQTNFDLSFEYLIDKYMGEKKILFQKDGSNRFGVYFSHNFKLSYDVKRWVLPNAGFIFIKNCTEVRNLIDTWLDLGQGELRHLADIHPRIQNVLTRGVMQRPELDKLIGYLPSKIVSKRNTRFCKHLSAMTKEEIAAAIKEEYDKIF